ncbi:MAG: ABC transporter ATP-binding protein [Alphaproteobacteria bacterium]
MLEVRGLTVGFGGVKALDGVSFTVGAGEIRGIIGPNGAGKTTLLNAICGLVRPQAGEVLLAGTPVGGLKPNLIAARGLGRTFQTSQLFRGMTVLENLMTGLHGETRAGLLAAAFGGRAMRAEEEAAREKAWKALEFVGMERFWDRPAHALSFGQQRVVEIARTLIADPKVVLLDEPAVGLSLNRLTELDRLLRRIRDERGVTLLMIEHVIRLVMEVCDRVTVMAGGLVIAEGTPAAVRDDPQVIEAYLGRRVDARRRAS